MSSVIKCDNCGHTDEEDNDMFTVLTPNVERCMRKKLDFCTKGCIIEYINKNW